MKPFILRECHINPGKPPERNIRADKRGTRLRKGGIVSYFKTDAMKLIGFEGVKCLPICSLWRVTATTTMARSTTQVATATTGPVR